MIKILLSLIDLQGIAFEPSLSVVMFLCWNQTMMYMKRLSNLFWKSLNLIWGLVFLLDLPQICYARKEHESISIMSKLTLVSLIVFFIIILPLISSWCSMFCAKICSMIILSSFCSMFYALRDFFPSRPPSNYLPKYV